MASAEEANHERQPIRAQKFWILAVKEAEDAKDFRRVSLTLDRMAESLTQLGNYEDAEGVLCMALEVKEQLYGSQHSEIISSLSNLVDALHAQKKYDQALKYARRLVDAYQATFGVEHPGVASIAVNMAGFYHGIQHPAAEVFYKQAISIKTKTLGYRNDEVTALTQRYAAFLNEIGRSDDANNLTLDSSQTVSGLWKTLAIKMGDRVDKLSDGGSLEKRLHERRRDSRS